MKINEIHIIFLNEIEIKIFTENKKSKFKNFIKGIKNYIRSLNYCI